MKRATCRRPGRSWVWLLATLWTVSRSADAAARTETRSDDERLIVKLTYVGPQDRPVPSLLLFDSRLQLPFDFFARFACPGELHANDLVATPYCVGVDSDTLRQLLLRLQPIAGSSLSTTLDDAKISLSVVTALGEPVSSKVFLDRRISRQVLASINRSLAGDRQGLLRMKDFCRHLGIRFLQ